MKTLDIEIAVMKEFNPRVNLIVPNISFGLGLHECDLLILTRAGYATEIEIKVSRKDLIQDKKKPHSHYSQKIGKLYFAIPEELMSCIDHIPSRAGIIKIVTENGKNYCRFVRNAEQVNKYKFSDKEKLKMAHLGAMRILTLKKVIKRRENQIGGING